MMISERLRNSNGSYLENYRGAITENQLDYRRMTQDRFGE